MQNLGPGIFNLFNLKLEKKFNRFSNIVFHVAYFINLDSSLVCFFWAWVVTWVNDCRKKKLYFNNFKLKRVILKQFSHIYQHLLTLHLSQSCLNFFLLMNFFLFMNTEENVLENGNQWPLTSIELVFFCYGCQWSTFFKISCFVLNKVKKITKNWNHLSG